MKKSSSKYLNTNLNQNLETLKKEFDISNLNFKSLQNGRNEKEKSMTIAGNYMMNKVSSATLPNDNNAASQAKLKRSKFNKFKSHSQSHLHTNDLNQTNALEHNNEAHIPDKDTLINYSNIEVSEDNINLNMDLSFTHNQSQAQMKRIYTNCDEISDVHTLKIIIQNLENELRERTDEIKVLRKNFKDKIVLMEQENKKTYDQIEIKHRMEINSIYQSNKEMLVELEQVNETSRRKYEEYVNKVVREYNALKNTTIPLATHNITVNELNFKWKENFEKIKLMFHEKLKEVVSNFETPEYMYLLERIQFFNLHQEKFDKILNRDFDTDEYTTFLDKIKLNIIELDTHFIKEMTGIQINYENIFNSCTKVKKDKLEELKEIVNKKFDRIETLKTFVEEGFKENEEKEINTGSGINLNNNKNNVINIQQSMELKDSNSVFLKNSLRESFPNKKEEFQFNSTLLKNALGSPIEGESISKSEFNEIQIGKDNFNTFKMQSSLDKLNIVDNSEDLFEGISYKKRISNVSEDLSVIIIYIFTHLY